MFVADISRNQFQAVSVYEKYGSIKLDILRIIIDFFLDFVLFGL